MELGRVRVLLLSIMLAVGNVPDFILAASLDEIVVTAQKREQGLQDVPISITVIDGEQISKGNIENMADLSAQIPSVTISEAAAGDQLFIRGIGSGINPGFEQSVGLFIDGIYFGRGRQSLGLLSDLERVEVLKGPQSTYFGNNTIAGAVNITTKKPGTEWEAYVNSLYEAEHEEVDLQFGIGGPVNDQLGVRIAGRYRDIGGWLENTHTNSDVPEKESWTLRGTVVYMPVNELEITLKLDGSHIDAVGNNYQISPCVNAGSCLFQQAIPGFEDNFDDIKQDGAVPDAIAPNASFTNDNHQQDSFNFMGNINYNRNGLSLISVTGFTSFDDDRNNVDPDFGPAPLSRSPRTQEFDQISQEFRIESSTSEKLEYVAGVYWQTSDLDFTDDLTFVPAGGIGRVVHHQDEETTALFGAATWHLRHTLRATAGLRWSKVEKEVERDFTIVALDGSPAGVAVLGTFSALLDFAPHPNTLSFNREDDDATPSLNIEWDVADEIMLYGGYAQGFKAGGFDALSRSPARTPAEFARFTEAINFAPETVDAYEVGIKTKLFDGSVTLNGALFRSDYEDLQVSTFDGVSGFLVGNAGESRTQGVEVDISWAATEDLLVDFSFVYLDAKYIDFATAQCRFANPRPNPDIPGVCILSGEPLLFSPELSGVFNLDYTRPLNNGYQLGFGLDLIFSDEYFVAADNDPNTLQDDFVKLNASISFGPADEKWSFSLVARNLTDEFTTTQGNDTPATPGSYFFNLNRTRSIALQARYNFF